MSETELDLSKIDEAFVIRPGDKVLLRYSESLSQEQAHRIREQVKDRIGLEALIVTGCDQIAVYRD